MGIYGFVLGAEGAADIMLEHGVNAWDVAATKAIVEEAARHGVRVAAHAHGPEGILAAVEAGVASIEHGSVLTDEILARMKEKGTYLVPTPYRADAIDLSQLPPPIRAKAEWILPRAKESVRKAIEKQHVAGTRNEDLDGIGIDQDGLEAAVQGFFVRKGRVAGRKGMVVDKVEPLATPELERDACGECAACRRMARRVHADLVVIQPGDTGTIKIEQVRYVIDRAGYRPFEGRRRAGIVD